MDDVSQTVSNHINDEIRNAKAYLLCSSEKTGLNAYDHLVDILTKILEERPDEVVEKFEDICREGKRSRFDEKFDTIQDQVAPSAAVTLAHEHKILFERENVEIPDTLDNEAEDEGIQILADIMENAFYFEQANVGLGREETFRIFLALKQLADAYPLQSCRFWGKMFGIDSNYIVAEVEFRDGADPHQDEDDPDSEDEDVRDEIVLEPLQDENNTEIDDFPKSEYKPPTPIPREEYGTGCNSKVYFVCSEPGQSWNRLPSITPHKIVVARQIKKLFTGRLDALVVSYPPFPGNESDYLRAQIARISQSTHVSPQGYYIFEEDEDEEDDAAGPDHFEINMEYEGLPVNDLVDPALSYWVHHTPYILPQGRCSWFNPQQKVIEEEDEEDEDEEREEPDEPEPEAGPPLLTPLSEDNEINGTAAWTAHKSSSLIPQYAIAVLHSNLWPGGHAFCVDKKFENIYVGWGQKYNAENYSPPAPPMTQEEYPSGPEITEADDPTVEQERALKAAQQEALEAEDEEEESEEFEEDD